ncbi:hypothetical protein AVEN_270558-1 [Araneus ventricosus]|uniref:Uncharacterized protein n=1 Tax=Araneus ventricosus TaxID=182803 RepID=A0A4Y2B4P3_ARAVE|nr:hypothetical protein AVEN_270558-1 [Araneus ventricosus]
MVELPCATQENRLQRHLASKFGSSVLNSKTVRYTGKKSITKLFVIIYVVREDTLSTVMLKTEAVKYIFVWFATPKNVTRHNAEEKRKRHTPKHPLSWHSVSLRDYNTRGPRSSVQQYIRDTLQQQVIGYGVCVE